MNGKRLLLILFGVGLFIVTSCVLAIAWTATPRHPPGSPKGPYTDLQTILEQHKKTQWSILIPPEHPGPYRLLNYEFDTLRRGTGRALVWQVHNLDGSIAQEMKLSAQPEYDQLVMSLETEAKLRTILVLKRD